MCQITVHTFVHYICRKECPKWREESAQQYDMRYVSVPIYATARAYPFEISRTSFHRRLYRPSSRSRMRIQTRPQGVYSMKTYDKETKFVFPRRSKKYSNDTPMNSINQPPISSTSTLITPSSRSTPSLCACDALAFHSLARPRSGHACAHVTASLIPKNS